ncbi:hypothetical protein H5T51_01800, partial [Candidatus Bathyarchaeota archaeon]|nr:hypothetical protein [Candidatus Bathyarchaeota archaeon]
TVKEAHKHSIPIDPRRKTAHEENIKTLKEILKTSEKPEKPSGKKGTRKSKNEKGQ